MEKNIDEKNTLKSLWESLAFLDEPEKSFDGYIENGSTSSISGSSHSVRVFEKTNICTCDSDQIIKTTGWTQLDLALIWHLNYTIRLLDKVYPDHLYVSSSQTLLSAQSSVSDVSDKTINNYTHNGSLNSVRNSVHSAWSTLPLLEQVSNIFKL